MVRKTMTTLLVALVAAFTLGSIAEAAPPRKPVRPRAKHSSRVTSGSGAATTTAKKPAAKKKKRAVAKSQSTAKTPAARKAAAKRKPTTKPR